MYIHKGIIYVETRWDCIKLNNYRYTDWRKTQLDSSVDTLDGWFYNIDFNGNINHWNFKNVITVRRFLCNLPNFNQPVRLGISDRTHDIRSMLCNLPKFDNEVHSLRLIKHPRVLVNCPKIGT